MRLLVLFIILATLTSAAPAAPPFKANLVRRQSAPSSAAASDAPPVPLSLYFPYETVYRNTSNYSCTPYDLRLSGISPPFEVAVVLSPYSAANLTAQNATVVGNATTGLYVDPTVAWLDPAWSPFFDSGTMFVWRVRDAAGRVVYSGEKEVKDGPDAYGLRCSKVAEEKKKKHQSRWDRMDGMDRFFAIGVPIAVFLFLLFACCCPTPEGKRRRQQRAAAQAAAAAAAVPLQTVARPAPVPAPVVVAPPQPAVVHAPAVVDQQDPPAYAGPGKLPI
ncbi:hypothetical protein JCM8097_006526 [Rhodosporidiobolus ruineniae]